ncbi:MAG: hypothetical protein U5Q44_06205 [Dehalococcoidia bacterium]|nr:hypothetical protein [Dehalococcoidia bacterium]
MRSSPPARTSGVSTKLGQIGVDAYPRFLGEVGQGTGEIDDPGLGRGVDRRIRHGQETAHGRGVDDDATTVLAHEPDSLAGAFNDGGQVDVDGAPPVAGFVVEEVGADGDAGVVADDIQAAEAGARQGEGIADLGGLGDVAMYGDGLAACRSDFLDDPLGGGIVDVSSDDAAAAGRHREGHGSTDTGTGPGDDCDAAVDLHVPPPVWTKLARGRRMLQRYAGAETGGNSGSAGSPVSG